MEKKKLIRVIEPNPKFIRLFFFWAGIIATIAYRIIIILNLYSPLWVKVSWYIGTIGFVLYFWHRFNVAKKRARLIKDYELIETVNKIDCIDSQKKLALGYLIKTSLTSKSRWNSAVIFILSLIALFAGIFIDVLKIK